MSTDRRNMPCAYRPIPRRWRRAASASTRLRRRRSRRMSRRRRDNSTASSNPPSSMLAVSCSTPHNSASRSSPTRTARRCASPMSGRRSTACRTIAWPAGSTASAPLFSPCNASQARTRSRSWTKSGAFCRISRRRSRHRCTSTSFTTAARPSAPQSPTCRRRW